MKNGRGAPPRMFLLSLLIPGRSVFSFRTGGEHR